MMDISNIGNNSTSSVKHLTDPQNDVLGKEDFLQLLLTQLTNQNPLEPMDNEQFISQMTDFSSLEQLTGISDALGNNNGLMNSLNNVLTADLVGREVVVNSNAITIEDGTGTMSGFYTQGPGTAKVTITGSSGQVVRELNIDISSEGFNLIDWDLKDSGGNSVDDGEYTVSVNFTDQDGYSGKISSYMKGTVESIKFEGGNTYMDVDGARFSPSQIIEILR
ncbi:MAG: hypothetical protein GF417_08560 [Candidatus Latescibacteria bacterium]|nr:hypothetical protein [bacterium]MBD3424473.1 hypothetical protein [Candidatus Latescibacterota bacterium]